MDSFDIYYIYILANKRNGTLYIGVTNNLLRRVIEHREKLNIGFAESYNVNTLVYYEEHSSIKGAIAKEKALKKWSRIWKLRIIEEMNPNWDDLLLKIATEEEIEDAINYVRGLKKEKKGLSELSGFPPSRE